LDRKPDDVEWLLLRADLVGARGRAAEALAQPGPFASGIPESRLARMKEAQWLSRLGRLNSAQGIYEALLEESSQRGDSHAPGDDHQWQGRLGAGSEAFFGEALRESREDPCHFWRQLRGLVAMGQVSRAWTRAPSGMGPGNPMPSWAWSWPGSPVGWTRWIRSTPSRRGRSDGSGLAQAQTALRALHWARAGRMDRAIELLRSIAEAQPPHYDAFIEAANGYAAVDEHPWRAAIISAPGS
jgi:tetratricopeptide (TPR) repeat protein